MNKTRVWTIVGCCGLALAVLAWGQARQKAGLWEVTTQMNMGGADAPQMPTNCGAEFRGILQQRGQRRECGHRTGQRRPFRAACFRGFGAAREQRQQRRRFKARGHQRTAGRNAFCGYPGAAKRCAVRLFGGRRGAGANRRRSRPGFGQRAGRGHDGDAKRAREKSGKQSGVRRRAEAGTNANNAVPEGVDAYES